MVHGPSVVKRLLPVRSPAKIPRICCICQTYCMTVIANSKVILPS